MTTAKIRSRAVLLCIILAPLAAVVFLGGALPIYSTAQRLLAWALFMLGVTPLLRFALRPDGVPLIELVALQYAIFFALPVFHQQGLNTVMGRALPASASVTVTLVAALLALASTIVGYRASKRLVSAGSRPILLDIPDRRLFFFGLASVAGSQLISFSGDLVPMALARPLMLVISQDLGLAILSLLFHRGRLARWQRSVALATLGTTVMLGLVGGMAQSALQPLLIWFLCSWFTHRRPPVLGFVMLAAAVIVLQPVKAAYRQAAWYGQQRLNLVEKVDLYGTLLEEQWLGAGTNSETVTNQARDAASERLSLLLSTARYVDWTPSLIDYKDGSTLLYVVYGLIPRFIWPTKPIAQSANVELPVAYGLQSVRSVNRTRFGVGHVAEVYVNFGLAGIIPAFLLLGLFFRIPPALLLPRQTIATAAILVALAVNMMYIGSTVGNIFGGFIQQIVVQVLLLKLLTSRRAPMKSSVWRMPLRVPAAS